MSFKSGFVSIIGKPNVGKSTLLNTLIKEKVAIISPKPQTTRNKIIGILNDDNHQIIFIDTPGIHTSKNKLDEFMQTSINSALSDVDIVLLLIDGSRKITEQDVEMVRKFDRENVMLIITKIDNAKEELLFPQLEVFNSLENIKDVIPISAHKGRNINLLLEKIKSKLTDNVKYFDDDIYTDKSVSFLVSETIREKLLWRLREEVPHGIAVEIIEFKDKENICVISADIICEKKSHKQIIIGKNGSMLKEIGSLSRVDIENLMQKKVLLQLFVKVREEWRDNKTHLKNLGYDEL